MKKLIFSLFALASALMLNAQVYYLLPGTADVNASEVVDVNVYLPYEGDGTEDNLEVSPERRAYNWFVAQDGFAGADYVTLKDLVDGLVDTNSCKTLWINIDRVGMSLEQFDAMFNDEVTNALMAYVQNGGNLYVSKQAARLASKILRTDWWPSNFESNGYTDATDEWQINIDFCTGDNVLDHACFQYMTNGQDAEEQGHITRYPMVSGEGTYRRTDNNCAWGDWRYYLGTAEGTEEALYGGCDPLRRSTFEEHIAGKVLGGWGHTRGLDYAGFIEFYPTDTYQGRVMAMGLAAYQWGAQNQSEYNVKNLTKGILEYLTPATPTAIVETESGCAQKFVEKGQIIIVKNGVRYNAFGMQIQ